MFHQAVAVLRWVIIFNAVIMIEDVKVSEAEIEIFKPVMPLHVRVVGEDIVVTGAYHFRDHVVRPVDTAAMLRAVIRPP